MNKIKKIIVGILVLIMTTALLYGCAPTTTTSSTSPSATATSAAPATSVTSSTPTSAGQSSDPNSPVYSMANRIPWSGLLSPVVASRADINKAIKPDNKKDKVKVGYCTWTTGTPFFAAMMDTVKAECAKYGYELTTAVSDSDVNKQISNVENMVTLGVDVIIDNAMDVNAETPAVKDAVAAGIPVISLGLPFPADVPVITTAACNYYGQGFMIGMLAADQFKGKDIKAATEPGMIGHTIAESKLNGFIGGVVYERAIQMGKPFATKEAAMIYGYNLEQEIVKNAKFTAPDYKFDVVMNIDGAWSQDGGLKATEDIVTAHPDINLVFADNDQEIFGAYKALGQAGFKVGTDVIICCVGDGTKQALQMVKDGTLLGLPLASPYTWSKACTDLVYKIYHDGFDATNLPSSVYLTDVLVTKDNVDKYMSDKEFTTLPDQVFTPIGK